MHMYTYYVFTTLFVGLGNIARLLLRLLSSLPMLDCLSLLALMVSFSIIILYFRVSFFCFRVAFSHGQCTPLAVTCSVVDM